MLRNSLRTACLVAILLAGCGKAATEAQNDAAAQSQPGRQPGARGESDDKPVNPFFRSLYDSIDGADDIGTDEADDARRTLREADETYRRIKAENFEALRQAARQVQVRQGGAPNLVLIVADDLGYGDLGCYGQTRIRTPRIDRLAAQGMRFTQFYAGSSLDSPSQCALMTGFHTGHCRIRGEGAVALGREDCTIAEVLWQAGYSTAMLGEWRLGGEGTTGTPNRQGFDHWFGYLDDTGASDHYPEFLWRNEERVALDGNENGGRAQYAPDLITEDAVAFLGQRHHRPFFLCVAYTLPGSDLAVPSVAPYDDANWPEPAKARAAMITRLDSHVGKILDRLQDLELDQNTVVMFTSDNGPAEESQAGFFDSTGPLRGAKGELYEGGIRAAMIVRWPSTVTPGTVSDVAWASWDILPTLADSVAAIQRPTGIDGISMVPTFVSSVQPEQERLYWELDDGGFAQALRTGRWKGLRTAPASGLELYDLDADPGEQHNVAAQHPDVVARIERLMATARWDSDEWLVPQRIR